MSTLFSFICLLLYIKYRIGADYGIILVQFNLFIKDYTITFFCYKKYKKNLK